MHRGVIEKGRRHSGLNLFIIVITVSLLVNATACTHFVRRLVFQPHKIDHVPDFPAHLPHLQRFWLETDQGEVEIWIVPARGVTHQRPGPAVMIAHGNRELIDYYLEYAMAYRNMGFTVLMGEYRGYGRSAGNPSREKIRADYIRFYDKLASLPGVDPERILFHGRSLGGAVLGDLLPHRRPAAVILESTFSSIKAMAYGAPDFLLSDNYDTIASMAAYDGPVLIIHGNRDQVVPVRHARELKKHIPQAVLFLDNFGHNSDPPDRFDYWKTIRRFIDNAML